MSRFGIGDNGKTLPSVTSASPAVSPPSHWLKLWTPPVGWPGEGPGAGAGISKRFLAERPPVILISRAEIKSYLTDGTHVRGPSMIQ